MFKKGVALLCAIASLGLLVGCQTTDTPDDGDDFEQNTNGDWTGFEMYMIGSHWNNWDTATVKEANPSCAFTKRDDGKLYYTAEITEEMVSGWVGFKFIADNSWNSQYGVEDLDFDACSEGVLAQWKNADGTVKQKSDFTGPTTNRSNLEITVAGTYTICYDPANFESEETDVTTYSNKFTITLE